MFVEPAFVCTSPKTETSSSRTVTGGAHPFSRNPRFTRKHYEQATRHHGKSKSIILSYDIGENMGDHFFTSFLPDLGQSLQPAVSEADLLRSPGAHHGIFSSIKRGKYLQHFIDGTPNSEQVYTYNFELDRARQPGLNQKICAFESLRVVIPSIGEGCFHFMGVSMSHRPHAPSNRPNELNLVFKFAFQKLEDDTIPTTRFSNDTHNCVEVMINIHFSRIPGNSNNGITTQAALLAFLLSAFQHFNQTIATELGNANLMNLNIDHIDEVSTHPAFPAGAVRGGFPGAAPAPGNSWRYTRAALPYGILLGGASIGSLYQPNEKNISDAPAPVAPRIYRTSTNYFGALAVDDDPADLVDIVP